MSAQTSIKTKKSLTTEQGAYLAAQRVARLATADVEGRPYVVPVCFALDGDLIYIALDSKPKSVPVTDLKRVRNIRANPYVSLLVDTYSEDWSRLGYLMVSGTAAIEPPGTAQHTSAIHPLREKYPQYRAMPIEERPIIAISITSSYEWSGSTSEETPPHMPTRPGVDFAALAMGRHVVRQFKPLPVPRELVETTLEAAGWAPSPHGAQPWRFVVLTHDDKKVHLADAMAADWRRNLKMDGESEEIVETRLQKSRKRIIASPVLIIPCLYLEELHTYPDPARRDAEVTMAVQSIGAAIQNMLLSAYSLGLETGWMCAPLFCPDIVRDALDLPPTLAPHALINMGYGAKDPPRRPHRPLSELVIRCD